MAALGLDRHVDAAQAANRLGPRSSSIHDQRRGNVSVRRADFDDAVAVEANATDFSLANDLDASGLRALRKAHGHAVGIGDAIGSAEGRAFHARDVETGRQRLGLGGGEPLHIDAARLLELDVLEKSGDVPGLGQQEEISVLVKIDRRADHLFKPRHHGNRFKRKVDVGGMRELVPHAAGILAGRTSGELRLALDQHDVGHPALGEMPGDAAAHASAADDHDICCVLHDGNLNLSDFMRLSCAHRSGGWPGRRRAVPGARRQTR